MNQVGGIAQELENLVEALRLDQGDAETFYGKFEGYPIAVSLFGSEENLGFLFTIRHPVTKDQLPDADLDWGASLQGLIDQKRINLEVDARIAWLTLYAGSQPWDASAVMELLTEALQRLRESGFANAGATCHYCGTNRAEDVLFLDGCVVQMCPMCLGDRTSEREMQTRLTPSGAAGATLLAVLGAGIGGVLWAVYWISEAWLIGVLTSNEDGAGIPVPSLVLLIAAGIAGLLAGAPVGYLIRRVPGRGDRAAIANALFGTCLAVLLGEILSLAILAYQIVGVFSLRFAASFLVEFWTQQGGGFFFRKSVALVCGLTMAAQLARPKLSTADL